MTKNWWLDTNPKGLNKILKTAEDYRKVLVQYSEYVFNYTENNDILFWSNHTIDWELLNSYFRSYGVKNPFPYWAFRDVCSYLEAYVPGKTNKYRPAPDEDLAHDALYDCEIQIDWMFETIRRTR